MLIASCATASRAGSYYTTGHITAVTTSSDGALMLMTDGGLPGNCTGTAYGWLRVAPSGTSIIALVLGLWLRDGPPTVLVDVYTTGVDGTGECAISQVQPHG
jgi:hypothetical protein